MTRLNCIIPIPPRSSVEFSDGKLHDIESSIQSGYTLRIIKDKMLGFSYTKNLLDPQGLIDNAISSLDGKVKAEYTFPETKKIPQLKTFDPEIEKITAARAVEECDRICGILSRKTAAEIELGSSINIESLRIANSTGTYLEQKHSDFSIWMNLCYPGGAAGLSASHYDFNFQSMPDEKIDALAELYNLSEKPVTPEGGKMQVLFTPGAMYALLWRLRSAANGQSIFKKTSPLLNRIGEQIFSEKLTITDNALDDSLPGARAFDDEGVPTAKLEIVQNGVLKNFYFDLEYAEKLKTASTGHGYKSAMWGGDPTKIKPAPALSHLRIEPGSLSLQEMIASMERGIILKGVMGAHSGNIPNGDFSVGVSPGIYVEKGRIIGRVKDAMVAGNIYETLKHVAAIENKLHPTWGGEFPAILFNGVSVSTK